MSIHVHSWGYLPTYDNSWITWFKSLSSSFYQESDDEVFFSKGTWWSHGDSYAQDSSSFPAKNMTSFGMMIPWMTQFLGTMIVALFPAFHTGMSEGSSFWKYIDVWWDVWELGSHHWGSLLESEFPVIRMLCVDNIVEPLFFRGYIATCGGLWYLVIVVVRSTAFPSTPEIPLISWFITPITPW